MTKQYQLSVDYGRTWTPLEAEEAKTIAQNETTLAMARICGDMGLQLPGSVCLLRYVDAEGSE